MADLWEKAIKQLDEKLQKKIRSRSQQFVNLESVLSSAEKKQTECAANHSTYTKRDGSKIEYRQVFGQVVQRLLKFKAIGDSVAAIDPTHLAVPWAAISLVLQVRPQGL